MDGLEDFRDLQGNNVNDFIKSYRDSLKNDYDATVANLQQQRRNDHAAIMSGANARGMMYSNFPERSKMQYDTDTYLPNLQKAYTSYQTGLDKLRSNALGAYNNIRDINDQIAHFNSLYQDDGDGDDDDDILGDYFASDKTGSSFVNANNKDIRFSTFARNNGYEATTAGYLKAAKRFLSENEYNRLLNIVKAQRGTSHPNLLHNANSYGSTYKDYQYLNSKGTPYLSESDRAFINNLGLTFGK